MASSLFDIFLWWLCFCVILVSTNATTLSPYVNVTLRRRLRKGMSVAIYNRIGASQDVTSSHLKFTSVTPQEETN